MRSFACLVVLLTSLAVPTAAAAKGLATVTVCGPADCVQLEDRELAARVASPQETVDPPAPAAYYRVRIAFEDGEAYSTLFVPSEELVATNAGGLLWYVPRTEALRSLQAAVRDLESHTAPRAWARYIETTEPQPTPAGSTGRFGWSWLFAVVALVVGGSALLAGRRRVWRPRSA
jgi:hypothetical protein